MFTFSVCVYLCLCFGSVGAYWPPASPSALSGIWWWCCWTSPSLPSAPAAASCSPSPSCAPQCQWCGGLHAPSPACSSPPPACWQPERKTAATQSSTKAFLKINICAVHTQEEKHWCSETELVTLPKVQHKPVAGNNKWHENNRFPLLYLSWRHWLFVKNGCCHPSSSLKERRVGKLKFKLVSLTVSLEP